MSDAGGQKWIAWTGPDQARGHYPGRSLRLSKKSGAQKFAEELQPNKSGEEQLLLLSRRRLFAFLDRRFEILDTLAQTLAQLGQSAGPKNQEGDHQDHQDFRQTQFAYHVGLRRSRISGALARAQSAAEYVLGRF